MSDSNRKISYFNTLIFTIFSGVVSLILLAALYFDMLSSWRAFIITIEIGIFVIIGVCIWQIFVNEALLEKYKRAANYNIDFAQCPDYYIKRHDNEKTICSNEYVVQGADNKKYIMKIYPVDNPTKNEVYPLPKYHVNSFNDSAKPEDKFDATIIQGDTTLPSTKDKCHAVLGLSDKHKTYGNVPWVGVRARCAGFSA